MKTFLIVIGSALFAPSLALGAGGSTTSGYGGAAGTAQLAVQKSGPLPFTGLNLTGVLLFGVLLLAAGFLIRRKARASS
jgi:hypothetical protein